MSNQCLKHVATYVVTDQNELVVQRKSSGKQVLGGCNFANSVIRMMNSLRLESMDEGAVVLTEGTVLRISPLFATVQGGEAVLLQVVLLKSEGAAGLWSPEKARSRLGKKIFGTRLVPENAGLRRNPAWWMKGAGNCVETISLADAVNPQGWRPCDWQSFITLNEAGVFQRILDQHTPYPSMDELVILGGASSSLLSGLEDMQAHYNHPSMHALRQLSLQPWAPILWRDASILQSREKLEAFLGVTHCKADQL